MTEHTTRTPVEHDTLYLDLLSEQNTLLYRLQHVDSPAKVIESWLRLHGAEFEPRPTYRFAFQAEREWAQRLVWDHLDALEAALALPVEEWPWPEVAEDDYAARAPQWDAERAERYARTWWEYKVRLSALRSEIDDLEAEYTGWPRYFLVVSSTGHVHRSMNCHTCNKGRQATVFALLPTMSGLDPEPAVKAFGPALCSICFPDAPVEWQEAEKVPASVATVLLEKGVEEFEKALAASKARRLARELKKNGGA